MAVGIVVHLDRFVMSLWTRKEGRKEFELAMNPE
jgi:hypothetical protein